MSSSPKAKDSAKWTSTDIADGIQRIEKKLKLLSGLIAMSIVLLLNAAGLFAAMEAGMYHVTWNLNDGKKFLETNHDVLMYIALSYLILLPVGQFVMSKTTAFDLKPALFLHNMSMSIMSIWGTICIFGHLHHIVSTKGWIVSMTEDPYNNEDKHGAAFAGYVFVLSKFWEYIDTLFLVVRKREVGFLHAYHHPATLFFTWWSYNISASTGIYFCGVNFMVHAIMYFYFAMMSIGVKSPAIAPWITRLQISQMVFGIGVIFCFDKYSNRHSPEAVINGRIFGIPESVLPGEYRTGIPQLKLNNYVAGAMYLSYFLLFLSFYIKKYIKNAATAKAAAKKRR